MKVLNATKNTIIGNNIQVANTFFKRLFGLIPRKSISKGEGLIIDPCNSIHMFFMSFPIDILFVDKHNKIVYILEDFRPWKISKIVWNAKYVIELPAGSIKESKTGIGDILKKEDNQ